MKIGRIYILGIAAMTVMLMTLVWSCGSGRKGKVTSEQSEANEKQRIEVVHQQNGNYNKKPIELTSEEFKKKVMDFDQHPTEWKFEGDKPAIVDFYATWCGPCKATAPIMDQLAVEYAGKVDFYKVDIDQQEDVAAAFNVQSIPAILFIPKKGDPNMSVGAMMKSQFEDIINKQLLK
jgi:thioredoxin